MVNLSGVKNFTFKKEEKVEKYIHGLLSKMISIIIKDINPEAIILSGSFGRGEGLAYIDSGKVVVDSDFEIGCVCKSYLKRLKVFKLEKYLNSSFKEDITLSFFLQKRFTKGANSNFGYSNSVLTLDQYDLICGSSLIDGLDYLRLAVAPNPNDIYPWEFNRLVFNRTAELIEAIISYDTTKNKRKLVKAVNKLLIAFGDCLLMRNNLYTASYAKKLENLENLQAQGFLNLDGFEKEIFCAYRRKLAIEGYDSLSEQKIMGVIGASSPVYKNIFKDTLGIKIEDWIDFSGEYLKMHNLSLKSRYFRGSVFMQNFFVFAKNKFRPFSNLRFVLSSKIPMSHKAYAILPQWLFKDFFMSSPDHVFDLPAQIKQKGYKIFSDWRYWSYYL